MAANMSFKALEKNHCDLTKVPPLESNRLIGFVNHFTMTLVESLRELETVIDNRFMRLESKLKICRKNLQILETRLDSIPILQGPSQPRVANPVVTPQVVSNEQPKTSDEVDETVVHVNGGNEIKEETAQPEKVQDERLVKFYKMLKVGVPLEAVKIKMISEDVDPDLLRL